MLFFQFLLQSDSFLPSEKGVLELIVAQNYWGKMADGWTHLCLKNFVMK